MAKYTIVVHLDDYQPIELPVDYSNDYELRKDVVGLGTNGVFQKNETDYNYYPPHKIRKIEVKLK